MTTFTYNLVVGTFFTKVSIEATTPESACAKALAMQQDADRGHIDLFVMVTEVGGAEHMQRFEHRIEPKPAPAPAPAPPPSGFVAPPPAWPGADWHAETTRSLEIVKAVDAFQLAVFNVKVNPAGLSKARQALLGLVLSHEDHLPKGYADVVVDK
jgi:hypothetical protein